MGLLNKLLALCRAGLQQEGQGADAAATITELGTHALLSAERLARQARDLAQIAATRAAAADALTAVLAVQGRWAETLAIDDLTVAESGETGDRWHRMISAALEAGHTEAARVLLAKSRDDLPVTGVLASRAALVGGDAVTALAEADAVLAGAPGHRYAPRGARYQSPGAGLSRRSGRRYCGLDRSGAGGGGRRPDPG
jgi:hypothetical protein